MDERGHQTSRRRAPVSWVVDDLDPGSSSHEPPAWYPRGDGHPLSDGVGAWVGDLDGDEVSDAVIVTNAETGDATVPRAGLVHVVIGGG